jgi:hypothetical protein
MRRIAAAVTASAALLAGAAPTTLTATLSGAQEVPPAAFRARGSATIRIDVAKKSVCYQIKVTGVPNPNGGHIHKGAKGKTGDIVVPLFGKKTSSQTLRGCVTKGLSASTLRRIVNKPGNYYVNVHNAEHPDGAARGQLRK